jgi:hypothetical protein
VAQETGIRPWIVLPPSDRLLTSVATPFGGPPASARGDAAPTLPLPRPVAPAPVEKVGQAPQAPPQTAHVPAFSVTR